MCVCVSAWSDVDLTCYEDMMSKVDLDFIDVLINIRPFGETQSSSEWESLANLWDAGPPTAPVDSPATSLWDDGVSDAECCRQLHMQLFYVNMGTRVNDPHPRKQEHIPKELWGCASVRRRLVFIYSQ